MSLRRLQILSLIALVAIIVILIFADGLVRATTGALLLVGSGPWWALVVRAAHHQKKQQLLSDLTDVLVRPQAHQDTPQHAQLISDHPTTQ